jgi:DNA mismatch repair ATPase MutS
MRVRLMYRDRDAEVGPGPRAAPEGRDVPRNADALIQDLELGWILEAMAGDDEFLYAVARAGLLSSLTDPGDISYRQDVLRDCLENPTVTREIYALAIEASRAGRWYSVGGSWSPSPGLVLSSSLRALSALVHGLERLRRLAERHADNFRSEGFGQLFETLAQELDDRYLDEVRDQLGQLGFKHGITLSARLGRGNHAVDYKLHTTPAPTWRDRLPFADRSPYVYELHERDEAGGRALREIRDRGINEVANAVGQSSEHVSGFFRLLYTELAFYIGCINLHERLAEKGLATAFPAVSSHADFDLSARGMYEVSLGLARPTAPVPNDLDADGKQLLVITGANQGGKSTFLRTLGQAQLMAQAGLFVGANSMSISIRDGVFTHFKREEDVTMESGKLDEELARMSEIVDRLRPDSVVLSNESFASTNEVEGSEIARQVVSALTESGVRVLMVTHMFDLAEGLSSQDGRSALFLRAERREDGSRTFKIIEAEPQATSYGEDLYRRVFGRDL